MRNTACAVLTAAAIASSISAADLVVTNTSDLVNGDTSSPAALMANPGSDGISLREAVMATNAAPGSQRITFDKSLAEKSIIISAPLEMRRDGITIEGIVDNSGSPAITIDGVAIPIAKPGAGDSTPAIIFVLASGTRIAHLRFTSIKSDGVEVRAGSFSFTPPSAPLGIHDVVIDGNEFDNRGFTGAGPLPSAIRVWSAPEGLTNGATLQRISIVNNHIIGLQDVGIIGQPVGVNCLLEDFLVDGNVIEKTPFPLEISFAAGSGNIIRRARITGNRLLDAVVTLVVGNIANRSGHPAEMNNVVEDTLISDNVVMSNYGEIDIAAALVPEGQGPGASNSIIRNTIITNNVIATGKGIYIIGGGNGSLNNRVDGVLIANNTIVTSPRAGVAAITNADGGTGNVIAGLRIENTIFVGPVKDQTGPDDEIDGDITAAQVHFSITQTSRFTGMNGNFAADPLFVNRAGGDYHLSLSSPAIDHGDADAAPPADLDCRPRLGVPDIGAYESGASPRNRLTIIAQGSGTAAATPTGLPCGSSLGFSPGTTVSIVAAPSPGNVFAGWTGDDGCKGGVLTMNADHVCIAKFAAGRRRAVSH